MTRRRRLLLVAVPTVAIMLIVKAQYGAIWPLPPIGIDMERPLLTADRWLAGGEPYLADAFTSTPGITQPYLYPPYTLPIYALFTGLPRGAVIAAGVLAMFLITLAACRRLQIPWLWMPIVLLWPPFAEGILDGNVQMVIFAAFVFLFYQPGGSPWRPKPRDIAERSASGIRVGGLSALIGAIKVSAPHPWVFVLRHRWQAAVGAIVAGALLVVATLPLTGIELWFGWMAQLRRASDPTWDLGGFALVRFVPSPVGHAIAALCLIAVWFVPRRDPAPWLGVLSVIGGLSLHIFGLVFLVPAMLKIRFEASIVVAALVATYLYAGSLLGMAIVLWCLLVVTLGPPRWRRLFGEEPLPAREPSISVPN